MPGAVADALEISTADRDMPDLAARSDLLAVELHPQPPVPRETVQQSRREVGHVTAYGHDLHDVRTRAWHSADYLMGTDDA